MAGVDVPGSLRAADRQGAAVAQAPVRLCSVNTLQVLASTEVCAWIVFIDTGI